MLEHLKEQLIEHGFVLNQRSSQEVFEKIVNTEENKYILKLVKLICTFITSRPTDIPLTSSMSGSARQQMSEQDFSLMSASSATLNMRNV